MYVDGFNLYHGLKDQFGRRMLWLDLVELSRSLRPEAPSFRFATSPPRSSTSHQRLPGRGDTSTRCSPRTPG